MNQTFLTRHDTDTGTDVFDSIAWCYEVHVKAPDNPQAQYAILYGNEDSPDRIEFYSTNDYKVMPVQVWYLQTLWAQSMPVIPPEAPDTAPDTTPGKQAPVPNTLNGMSVLGFYNDTVFIRIPREIAGDCKGGCNCPYCVAHPELTPKWDTLCVDLKNTNPYGHTWTVHMPEYNKLLRAHYKANKAK